MPSDSAALHAIVEGRVQGVGFRYFVAEHAAALHLTGWVRNRERGEVEVYAEGPTDVLETLLRQLERGPGMAYVSQVTAEWLPAAGKYTQFSIAPTDW